jgi:hypothetical protein
MDWIMVAVQIGIYLLTVGAIYGTIKTELKYIKQKLDSHNNFVSRVYALERNDAIQDYKIRELKEKEN